MTVLPRPGASISAAMVTMDSAAIMVWLIPTMIVRFAVGSSTFRNVCPSVAPSEALASTVSPGTLRMP